MECKYILYDVLETVKNMTANYATALNEASSEAIYKEFKKEFDSLSNLAKELFNYKKIMKLLEDHKNGKKDCYKKVWTIYTFIVWYQQYFEA